MKREEAEKLAGDTIHGAGLGSFHHTQQYITDAILSAYRKGAEEMRERCAEAAGGSGATPWRVRELPLTDDPEEANGQDVKTNAPGPTGQTVDMRIVPHAPRQTGDDARTDGSASGRG